MKKHKNLIFYISTIGIFSLLIYFSLYYGKEHLEKTETASTSLSDVSAWQSFIDAFLADMSSPIALLLIQIVVILLVVRLFGWICQKIGQPTVIGEIIAGIVLGPSLLGYYFPEISEALFPISSLGNISFLSQIGLVLFMFIVGMELDLSVIRNRANEAVTISHASIIFPFTLGVVLAYFIYSHYTGPSVNFVAFALFMGISMSITAFPVLARIVHERGLHKKPLGAMVITCAAIDDITAWCLLAAVIAIVKAGTFTSSLFVILTAIIYIFLMFTLVRPFLKRIADLQTSKNTISKSIVGIFFLVLFLSAYMTEIIGIHALFGAFLAGVIMPTNINFRKLFIDKIEDVALVLLLPLFFVYTGLRTQIGLLDDAYAWTVCGCIILVAVSGKFLASMLASRFVGLNWHASVTIGALMNTRGLMELIVLNIGYDLGILGPEIFAMMVVMALITTFMTSPILDLTDRIFKNKTEESEIPEKKTYKILVPFGNTDLGKKLLLLASAFAKRDKNADINMLYVSLGNNFYQYDMEQEEKDVFDPINETALEMDQAIDTTFEVASHVESKIVKVANKGEYDFLLLGVQASIYEGNLLGRFFGFSNRILNIPTRILQLLSRKNKATNALNSALDERTQSVITNSDMPTGIFIDKGLEEIKNVFVPIWHVDDVFVGDFIERLMKNSNVRIILWDAIGLIDEAIEISKIVRSIQSANPYMFQLWNNHVPIDCDILNKQDLVMISLKSWKALREKNPSWIKSVPSTLLLTD